MRASADGRARSCRNGFRPDILTYFEVFGRVTAGRNRSVRRETRQTGGHFPFFFYSLLARGIDSPSCQHLLRSPFSRPLGGRCVSLNGFLDCSVHDSNENARGAPRTRVSRSSLVALTKLTSPPSIVRETLSARNLNRCRVVVETRASPTASLRRRSNAGNGGTCAVFRNEHGIESSVSGAFKR